MPTLIDYTSDPQVVRRRPTDMGTSYGHSTGGVPYEGAILDRPGYQGIDAGSSMDRAPGYLNDTLITRARAYMYRRAYYIQPATAGGNISWTNAGPIKDMPTTRFNRNIRPIVGGSNQSSEGMHTYLPTGQKQVGGQLQGKNRMRPGKQNQLSVQRYRGQSYSQTTQPVN